MIGPKVVICGAVRTPIASIAGALQDMQARPLLVHSMKNAIKAAKVDPKFVQYTTVGWVMQDPRNPNISKSAAEEAGVPFTSGGTTVHENCQSGGAAVHDICRRIKLGEINCGMAAGIEAMSNVPRYMYAGRLKGQTYGDMVIFDGLMGALTDITTNPPKGTLAGLLTEQLVERYKVSRELQDEIAYASHHNALNAWKEGYFHHDNYICPVEIQTKKGTVIFDKDQGPKDLPMEHFTKQKPYFKKDGTITGANASSLNDASAAIILASEAHAKELGLPILGEIRGFANVGVQKEYFGEGAWKVIPRLMERSGMKLEDMQLIEMNEAFAAVLGGAINDMGPKLNRNICNLWGSGVGLGHPVGVTGCRQVVDMVHQLHKRGKEVGMCTRCVGMGIGGGEVVVRM